MLCQSENPVRRTKMYTPCLNLGKCGFELIGLASQIGIFQQFLCTVAFLVYMYIVHTSCTHCCLFHNPILINCRQLWEQLMNNCATNHTTSSQIQMRRKQPLQKIWMHLTSSFGHFLSCVIGGGTGEQAPPTPSPPLFEKGGIAPHFNSTDL